jgi:hypothetical protein
MVPFEKLLKETCPNHAYPIKHKLMDCDLMKSFMTIGSLSCGMEVDKAPIEGNATPFLEEDAIITVYNRHPSPERHCVLDPSLGTTARCGRGWGNVEM